MEEVTLKITGMSCGHCVGQITKALAQLDAVQVKTVRVGEAVLTYDKEEITPADIVRVVNEAGMGLSPSGGRHEHDGLDRHCRRSHRHCVDQLVLLSVATPCCGCRCPWGPE